MNLVTVFGNGRTTTLEGFAKFLSNGWKKRLWVIFLEPWEENMNP